MSLTCACELFCTPKHLSRQRLDNRADHQTVTCATQPHMSCYMFQCFCCSFLNVHTQRKTQTNVHVDRLTPGAWCWKCCSARCPHVFIFQCGSSIFSLHYLTDTICQDHLQVHLHTQTYTFSKKKKQFEQPSFIMVSTDISQQVRTEKRKKQMARRKPKLHES